MPRNTGRTQLSPATSPSMWIKHDPSTGQFLEAKKSGGAFKGVRARGSLWQRIKRKIWYV